MEESLENKIKSCTRSESRQLREIYRDLNSSLSLNIILYLVAAIAGWHFIDNFIGHSKDELSIREVVITMAYLIN